jgi:DNA-binding transcriptional regulator YdaS (Cro superfamily)
MKLDEFMKDAGLDDVGMAALIGECSEFAVKKWRYGERTPRPPQMLRILQATDGKVTPNDFANIPESPSADETEQAAA